MANYNSEFFWKGKRATRIRGTANARRDDTFIYIKFITPFPAYREERQIISAHSVKEAAGYLRHIFLRDVINDNADLTDGSPNRLSNEQRSQVEIFFKYYDLLDPLFEIEDEPIAELKKICDSFTEEFQNIGKVRYKVKIAHGADQLRELLNTECFAGDKVGYGVMRLICSNDSFDGKELDVVLLDLFD